MRGTHDNLPDALFFYQLLLPFHDTKRTVAGDPRVPFYQEVAKWSLVYAVTELNLVTSGYGTYSRAATSFEFLHWDGLIVMDGVLGGSAGAFFRRFDKSDTGFSPHISEVFTKERWHQIKRVYRLCDNKDAPKRGTEGYNPAYKYHYLYDTAIQNLNSITAKADDDQCIDETTFPFNGFGEPGAALVGKIMNKPGVTKGAQLVLCTDVNRIWPRAFIHRHNKHPKLCSMQGPNEIRLLHTELKKLTGTGTSRNIFKDPKTLFLTCDNFFSGAQTTEYVAEEGFGCCFTTRRDCLPKEIPSMYLQKETTGSKAADFRPRAVRFEKPIIVTKEVGDTTLQLVSFQSTPLLAISWLSMD
jgi:hypothetical protein